MSALRPYRDFDGSHRVEGYSAFQFSTDADAKAAIALAREYYSREMQQDQRYRRAAERAKA